MEQPDNTRDIHIKIMKSLYYLTLFTRWRGRLTPDASPGPGFRPGRSARESPSASGVEATREGPAGQRQRLKTRGVETARVRRSGEGVALAFAWCEEKLRPGLSPKPSGIRPIAAQAGTCRSSSLGRAGHWGALCLKMPQAVTGGGKGRRRSAPFPEASRRKGFRAADRKGPKLCGRNAGRRSQAITSR